MIPTKPGFYWAKWRIADDHVERRHDYTPCNVWEIVQVYRLDMNAETEADGDRLCVWIGAVPGSHSLDGFHWGPGPLTPPPDALRDVETTDQKMRRAHAKYASMTPDQREEFLQAQRRKEKA